MVELEAHIAVVTVIKTFVFVLLLLLLFLFFTGAESGARVAVLVGSGRYVIAYYYL